MFTYECVCVCVCVSLPYIIQDASSAHVWRLEQLCDSVVRLESFAGSEDELSALYRDYHGTCTCLLCGAFASVYKRPITSYKSKIKLLHRCQLSRIWRDSPEFLLLLSRVPTFCRLSRHNIRRILPSIRRSIVNIRKVPNYRQESRFFRGFAPESFIRRFDTYVIVQHSTRYPFGFTFVVLHAS